MGTRLLEYIENAGYRSLLGLVGLVLILAQLVAIGAVAGDQVRRQEQREQARLQERTAQLRCLERPGQPQGCRQQVSLAQTTAAVPRSEIYSLHELSHPLPQAAGRQQHAVFYSARLQ